MHRGRDSDGLADLLTCRPADLLTVLTT